MTSELSPIPIDKTNREMVVVPLGALSIQVTLERLVICAFHLVLGL